MQTLIIDNYDSYTFNLYQMLAEINEKPPIVIRNDRLSWPDLQDLLNTIDNIVISPGPGHPKNERDFGICQQILKKIKIPLLGVCLGHQGIGYIFGGRVIPAPEVRHGRLSKVYHNSSTLFKGIPEQFSVVRYHSLIVDAETLPECLEVTAWTEDRLIMGLKHRQLPFWGVQFHPESICTEYGDRLLKNFREITQQFQQKNTTITGLNALNRSNSVKHFSVIPEGGDRPSESRSPTPRYSLKVFTKKLDIYTNPEQVFIHLFGQTINSFWLDSSQIDPISSRFSYIGDAGGKNSLLVEYETQNQSLTLSQWDRKTHKKQSIFNYLQEELERRYCPADDLPFDFNCGFVGYFGYELKAECGSQFIHPSPLPDATFIFADRLLIFDHLEQVTYLLYLDIPENHSQADLWFEEMAAKLRSLPPLIPLKAVENKTPIAFRLGRSRQTYIQDIKYCLQEIQAGESYEICLTNQIKTEATPDPLTFYRTLRQKNPAPYAAFFRFQEFSIACSSPERFLKIDRQGWVETKPIKGTMQRGESPEEDAKLREELGNSEKDRAENLMVLDLLRNDLGQTCEIGTISVPNLMEIETYATVHQLVSTIRGHLRSDLTAIDCIKSAFPGGSMTGAPKIRTMEIIDRLEGESRGIYSGVIGFLGLNGTAEFNIVIRTAILTEKGTSIGIGGGIIALSEPEIEFQEALLKAKALLEALKSTVYGELNSIMLLFLQIMGTNLIYILDNLKQLERSQQKWKMI
ncbi:MULTISPECIES: aminodeoxychorismate synthase [Spirulina sp. CCY15215]|uniref:aminodeoxychorismate synthase n=1 Tax=Spirulina sp. CCY15215 TaxID=2767591 RepID=UPI001950578C|nr:aminodeoxychorismate synthase [Spirulina major]